MVVYLTNEYEVELQEEEGLTHLFNAVLGESLQRVEKSGEQEYSSDVQHLCLSELHYIAGQLKERGSGLTLPFLVDEFSVHWEMAWERAGQDDGS